MKDLLVPPSEDPNEIVKWLMTLPDEEITAGYKQYFDRWNWETGSEFDRLMCEALKQESIRREAEIEHILIIRKDLCKENLDKILDSVDKILNSVGAKIYYDNNTRFLL